MKDSSSSAGVWRQRHVVICNWRDGGHPAAGGAELYCEQVAAQLHAEGVQVTYLTARAKGQQRREDVPYGRVVRGGGTYTVYLFVLLWLLLNRRTVDGVIDSQNGIPFFTPLALRRCTPVVLLIHHVHQDQFEVHFPRPAARVGQLLENQVSRWVYGRRAVCAVSPSSRSEIRRRLSFRGPIHLAPCGQHLPADRLRTPALRPRIVCVGRLMTQKRIDVLLRAMTDVAAEVPAVELHLVGDGEARSELEELTSVLGLTGTVHFHGRVPDDVRDSLVGSAWLTASASMGEGWGLSIMESAAAGVPAVAFSVPGLRDTIRPGETGWLVERTEVGTPDTELPGQLAGTLVTALRTLADPRTAQDFSDRCVAWAGSFTWQATTGHLLSVLTAEQRRLVDRPVDRRPGSDSAVLVTLPAVRLAGTDLTGLRVTDLIQADRERAAILLVGADEQDGRRVLTRLGIDHQHPSVEVRLARHRDHLGWRAHPPVRPAAVPAGVYRSTGRPVRDRLLRLAVAPLGVFVLAVTLRLIAIDHGYDIFVDEISYVGVARNLTAGEGLTLNDGPFHLHPPGFFLLLAALFDLLGVSGDPATLVLAVRPVAAVAGAVVCAGTTLLLTRVVYLPIALTAGLLLAIDPFLLRFDSRVMLEAPAMAAAVLGLCVLMVRPGSRRLASGWGVLCGTLLAGSVLTKEWYVFVTVVPVAVLCLSSDPVERRLRRVALGTFLVSYLGYVLAMVVTGTLPDWWAAKVSGLSRAAGVEQATGFNQPGAESFGTRLIVNVTTFGASYAVIAIGALTVAALLVLRRRRPLPFVTIGSGSVVTALGVGAFAFIGYAFTFGTLEEQMFYPVLVTSVVLASAALHLALQSRRWSAGTRTAHRRLTATAAIAVAAVLAADSAIWADIRTHRDDTYRQLLAWVPTGLPPGSTVAATEDVAQFVLTGVRLGQWASVPELVAEQVDFVVVSTSLSDRGYGHARPSFVAALDADAAVAFDAHGSTMGNLRVYDVRRMVQDADSDSQTRTRR